VVEVKPDGSTGRSVRITKETSIGSGSTDLSYPRDTLLAPTHASIAVREAKVILRDLGSPNGTFVKQHSEGPLKPGDVFLLGKTLFRFTSQGLDLPSATTGTVVLTSPPAFQQRPSAPKLEQIQLNGDVLKEFPLDKPEITIGRVTGDLVFGDDRYMSGTHARIIAQPGGYLLQDMKSRNGIYRRLRGETELADGDEFFAGEQLFRVEVKSL
jgi:pSer/pThr/pTyr-binding forkhead associated (FHA) protein